MRRACDNSRETSGFPSGSRLATNASGVSYLIAQGLDVNASGDFHQTPMFLAVRNGDVAMIELLLKLGADGQIPDHLGVSPQEAPDRIKSH